MGHRNVAHGLRDPCCRRRARVRDYQPLMRRRAESLANTRNRAAIRLASAAIVVAAVGLLALAYVERRDDQRSRAADYNACGRVNVTRARVNSSAAGIW